MREGKDKEQISCFVGSGRTIGCDGSLSMSVNYLIDSENVHAWLVCLGSSYEKVFQNIVKQI